MELTGQVTARTRRHALLPCTRRRNANADVRSSWFHLGGLPIRGQREEPPLGRDKGREMRAGVGDCWSLFCWLARRRGGEDSSRIRMRRWRAVDGRRFRRWPPRPGAHGLVGFPCFVRWFASPPGAHAAIPSDPKRQGAPRQRSRTKVVALPVAGCCLAGWCCPGPGCLPPPLEIGF